MSANDSSCSREHSRQARKIIAKSVYPFLDKDTALAIPPACPLHPELDVFKDQELHKRLVPGKLDTFQCGYCQKQFKTEFYMDRHMDNKHADRLNLAGSDAIGHGIEPAPGRCLGDLCPELGCGDYAADSCSVEIHAGGGSSLGAGAGTIRRGCGACDPADMERRRRRCRALFHGCFDDSTGSAGSDGGIVDAGPGRETGGFGSTGDYFVRQFCDHLACDDHHRPLAPPVDGGPANRRHPLPRAGVDGVGTGKPKVFLIVVVVIGLVVLYASMALRRWSTSTRHDLRPARRGRVSRGSDRAESRSATAFATGVRGSSRQELRQRRVTQALG
ncbi:unnamed protein product [Ectocarpus sp. 8 AP-2014]